MKRFDKSRKRGTSLIEVMLASAILLLVVLSLLEGFIVAARIAKSANGEPLAADAYAYDLAWTIFNQRFSDITPNGSGTSHTIPADVAPSLCVNGWPAPTAKVRIEKETINNRDVERHITVDVNWGAADNRKNRRLKVTRSCYGRAPE